MSRSRHRAVKQRGSRRKIVSVAAAAALVAGGTAVALQTVGGEPGSPAAQPDTTTYASDDATGRTSDDGVSRSDERDSLSESDGPTGAPGHDGAGTATVAAPEPAGKKFVTTGLNVRTGPGESYEVLTTLETGTKITVTDRTKGPWAEVIYEGEARWVTAEYLSNKAPEDTGVVTDEPCASGSDVESGLMPDAILVHRAVCAEFPEVTAYGGLRPGDDGEHGTGQALDIMISGSTGDEIAAFVQENASELGVSEVLWEQHIWTVDRASEGWRPMEDRGSTTANHYDHVHVTVYGDSAG